MGCKVFKIKKKYVQSVKSKGNYRKCDVYGRDILTTKVYRCFYFQTCSHQCNCQQLFCIYVVFKYVKSNGTNEYNELVSHLPYGTNTITTTYM